MRAVPRSALRAALAACLAATAACTSLAPASRPAPAPVPRPAPPPAAESRPAPAPLPPPGGEASPPPQPPRDVPAPRPQSDASSVSTVLLEQSRAQRAAGSMPAARASLERALRLDPNNAALWLELGELELSTGNTAQAATMARKALTLAGRDLRVSARAERLLRAAE
jgi:tetratricopeptide (TPR) repeat protein